jgi:hypothetical protein
MNLSPCLLMLLALSQAADTPKADPKADPKKTPPAEQATTPEKKQEEKKPDDKKPAAQDDLAEKVKELFKQLDDPSAEKRDAAEKGLVELGPSIMPLLPRVTPRTSAEVKDRLLRISKSLDKVAAEEIIKPKMLTLAGEASLKSVLEEIEKQTGNKVRDMRMEGGGEAADITIKSKLENVPFWQGLDQILDEAELSVEGVATESGALGIIPRPEGQAKRFGKAFYSGPFRFETIELEAKRSLRAANMERLKLFIEATWEPRLRPVIIEQKLEDVIAKDDMGNVIPIDGADGDIAVDVEFDASLIELEIPLKLPSRDIKKISSVKGKASVVLLGRDANFEFANITKAKEVKQTQAGVTVVLESVAKSDDVYEVRMRVELDDAQGTLESFRAGIFSSEAYLLSPNLERIDNDGEEASREDENVFGRIYEFSLDGDISKYKFVFKTPVTVIRTPVEYELKDIELP